MTKLPPVTSTWVWVNDDVMDHETDMRVNVYDAGAHRLLGQIDAGFWPSVALSPDAHWLAVATTYFSRGSHGARTDVVEFTDNATLEVSHEVALPPKRLMGGSTFFSLSFSGDGRWLYVPFLTPATSVGVIDVAGHSLVGEIETAGCVLAIPGGPNRFSALCEDGRLLTVSLDAAGREQSRAFSAAFFAVEADPIFAQGIPGSGRVWFLSFQGRVHEVDVTGARATVAPPWSLAGDDADRAWRPGGLQIGAVQARLRRLYVLMHRGAEGTHKEAGTEIWVYDLPTHRRLARWPLAARGLGAVESIQVTQGEQPLLLAVAHGTGMAILDAVSGERRYLEPRVGADPGMMFIH